MSDLDVTFVDAIPDDITDGRLYVSMHYGTAVHQCQCGCGGEVVTPFTPTDWKLIFDGETVTLHPSISNSTSGCGAHYFIDRNTIRWCRKLKPSEMADRQRRDRLAKTAHFEAPAPTARTGWLPHLATRMKSVLRRLGDMRRR